MKATCKECKGTGTLTLDNPAIISNPMSFPCFSCSGTAFKGMSNEQITWYRAQYKMFGTLRSKALKTEMVADPIAYLNLKNGINKACGRLGITLQPIVAPKPTRFGENVAYLTLRAEMKEYERRLTAIPVTISNRLAAAA